MRTETFQVRTGGRRVHDLTERVERFAAEVVPVTLAVPSLLDRTQLVVLSGGFSYGDYVMAGRLAQLETELRLGDSLRGFLGGGGYVLGICNGFQILTKLGILPPGSLIDNASGRFQCQWVTLENRAPDSPFLRGMPATFELPVANAEGRFVTADPAEAESYLARGLAARLAASASSTAFRW